MRRRQNRNSNLFSIDLDGIVAVLADANGPLINKAEEMLGVASRFSDAVQSVDEAEQLKAFLKSLRAQTRDVSSARLSDGRPFTDAAAVVKAWFGKTENRLKAVDKKLSGVLTKFASEVQYRAEEIRRRNAEIEAAQNEEADQESRVIGVTVTGAPVVTVNSPSNASVHELEDVPETPNVELIWQAKDFNREDLDLEKLRLFLTDYAIKLAINAHIKEHGPNQIDGVSYEQVMANKI